MFLLKLLLEVTSLFAEPEALTFVVFVSAKNKM